MSPANLASKPSLSLSPGLSLSPAVTITAQEWDFFTAGNYGVATTFHYAGPTLAGAKQRTAYTTNAPDNPAGVFGWVDLAQGDNYSGADINTLNSEFDGFVWAEIQWNGRTFAGPKVPFNVTV